LKRPVKSREAPVIREVQLAAEEENTLGLNDTQRKNLPYTLLRPHSLGSSRYWTLRHGKE
jgi:hypothetical protein